MRLNCEECKISAVQECQSISLSSERDRESVSSDCVKIIIIVVIINL